MFPQYQNQFHDDDDDSNFLFQFISDLDQTEIDGSIKTGQQQQQQQQPVIYWDFAAGTSSSPDAKRKSQRRPETAPADVEGSARKKIVHRNVERQRRQEMATLHTSLRDLLPVEYIKGKRSVSDHLGGALSYIKDLQKRLERLGTKRDDLNKVSASAHSKSTVKSSSLDNFVQVRPCLDGVEVVIGSCLELSKVMKVLLQEGFTVVSCISTRIEDEMIHTIQTEISNAARVDISQLEQKLMQVLTSN